MSQLQTSFKNQVEFDAAQVHNQASRLSLAKALSRWTHLRSAIVRRATLRHNPSAPWTRSNVSTKSMSSDFARPHRPSRFTRPTYFGKKRLESGHFQWEFPRMKTLTVDDRQRIRLPKARAGQVFAYETGLGRDDKTRSGDPEARTKAGCGQTGQARRTVVFPGSQGVHARP